MRPFTAIAVALVAVAVNTVVAVPALDGVVPHVRIPSRSPPNRPWSPPSTPISPTTGQERKRNRSPPGTPIMSTTGQEHKRFNQSPSPRAAQRTVINCASFMNTKKKAHSSFDLRDTTPGMEWMNHRSGDYCFTYGTFRDNHNAGEFRCYQDKKKASAYHNELRTRYLQGEVDFYMEHVDELSCYYSVVKDEYAAKHMPKSPRLN
ncbi:hypothetical protein SYNPS1DRAFT_27513 [Syncephalis pseudoplumigaleata]|uniref:Uncharacterized protein n=1 Tax=Syncephalis pseudoplumigaleata TaxID=1712513 RepID=A0A4P9Z2T3_9FUNG|nr:hypothetical protein SYNPS1DRAFT_27513 [Syncephalis pseudoplumigaleata]|eukprot:RKP26814.1 hypothetical protein SYNPS1DRAFT_27513 [Syncephalis pseudoplumigaleata]